MPTHPISWRSILILSYHLRLGLPSDLLTSGLSTKTLYISPVCHTCHMSYSSLSTWINPPNDKWWAVQIMKLPVMLSPPLPFHLGPLMPKCLSQHPILEHPHLMSLSQCETPSLTPIHNRQNYSAVYLDIYIFDIIPTQKWVITYVPVYLFSMSFHWLASKRECPLKYWKVPSDLKIGILSTAVSK